MANQKVTVSGTTVVVGDNDKITVNISGGGDVTIVADPSDAVDRIQVSFGGDLESDSVAIDLSSFSQNGLEIDLKQYDPTDSLNLIGASGLYIDPNNPQIAQFSYVGADGATYTGIARLKDGGERDFLTSPPPIVICFAKGSMIATKDGLRAVEDLCVGDLVETESGTLEPIRWIGSRMVDTITLAQHPTLQPITIRKDAYGSGVPFADLTLSPQHRVKVSDWRTELLFGETDMLIAVKHLVDGHRVVQRNVAEVTYYHIMLDNHELINSNGLISESLHAGDMATLAIGEDALRELETLFPALVAQSRQSKTVAPVLKKYEGAVLHTVAVSA